MVFWVFFEISLLSLLSLVAPKIVFVNVLLNLVLPLLFCSRKILPPKILAIGVSISCHSFIFLHSTMDYPACLIFALWGIKNVNIYFSLRCHNFLCSTFIFTSFSTDVLIINFIENRGKICIYYLDQNCNQIRIMLISNKTLFNNKFYICTL